MAGAYGSGTAGGGTLQGAPPQAPGMAGANAAAQNPWTGLAGVLSFLAGGNQVGGYTNSLNDNVYQQLLAGHEGQTVGGHHYGVQGSHGALSGLSPWAAHWIAQNLLQKNVYKGTDTTNLTGDALFKATLQNALGASQAPSYALHTGIDQAYLDSLFGDHGQNMMIDGHNFYNKGYNETGGHAPKGGKKGKGK